MPLKSHFLRQAKEQKEENKTELITHPKQTIHRCCPLLETNYCTLHLLLLISDSNYPYSKHWGSIEVLFGEGSTH